jgi:hypothetical protein
MSATPGTARIARAWVAVVVVVLGVVPLALNRDSYPLSTYPMFSSNRTTREPVDTAVLITADGTESTLNPEAIAGTDEPIIATVVVGNAIANGTADTLCSDIARRLDAGATGRVEIITVVYDALDWFAGRRDPVERHVHATCSAEAS